MITAAAAATQKPFGNNNKKINDNNDRCYNLFSTDALFQFHALLLYWCLTRNTIKYNIYATLYLSSKQFM